MSDTVERITQYLSKGGLFNPEMANHQRVSELLIDCREKLLAGESVRRKLIAAESKVDALFREKEELLRALRIHGAHNKHCSNEPDGCICGLDAAIRALVREQQNTTQEQPDVN